jgi:hypothetical protein
MSTYSFEHTVNPGRFRRQKAAITERVGTIQALYAKRREEAAAEARRIQFNRACLQAVIVGIKTALNFTVAECEQPAWPDSPWYTPKTFKPEFYQRAMRYFDPAIAEEFFHKELSAFKEFWQIEEWVGARYTMVENMETDDPWWKIATRSNMKFPHWPEELYYFDMARIKFVKEKCSDDEICWKHWKLKTPQEHLDEALKSLENLPTDAAGLVNADGLVKTSSEVNEIYRRVFSDPKLMQEMADKNQGYVHGHMWWNRPGKWLRKLFNRRT